MKDPYGGIPVVDTDPYGGTPVVDSEPETAPQGNVIDPLGIVDPLSGYGIKVAGEAAAGANESIIGFFDLLAKTGNLAAGGYSGVMKLLQTGDLDAAVAEIGGTQPIPELSTVINDMLADIGTDARIGGRVMEEGTAQQVARAFGNVFGPGVMGMTQVAGRDLTRLPGQAAELAGFGSAAPAKAVSDIVDTADDLARLSGDDAIRSADDFAAPAVVDDAAPIPPANKKLARELAVKRGRGDKSGVGFKLDDAGNAVPDPSQSKAIKVGVDKGAIAMMKAASKSTKARMEEMLDIVEGGKENMEYRSLNRPSRVPGKAIESRLKEIRQANKDAGKAIDEAAEGLKSEYVDVQPAMERFLAELDNQGIIYDPKTGAIDFSESSIEGLTQAQNIIKRMVNRLRNTNKGRMPTAHDVHRAKRFIDNQVTYGKTQAGLSGEMAGILKRLRHDLDGILDANFDSYNKANTKYADTVRVLDEIQSMAGRRVDLLDDNADRALGIMSRKILSNYAEGTPMLNMFNEMDAVASKYGNTLFDDEIIKLVNFEAELRRLFPDVVPPNTLQGNVGMETARTAADLATGNKFGPIGRGLGNAAEKVFGNSEEDQIAALRALLKD